MIIFQTNSLIQIPIPEQIIETLVNIMRRLLVKSFLSLLVLGWILSSQTVKAIDGDVEYSAPYIMVDPDTGQIVTVNPGPRLKAHEIMPTNEQGTASPAPVNAAVGEVPSPAIVAEESLTALPTIAMVAFLFMVVGGFFIWKANQRGAA